MLPWREARGHSSTEESQLLWLPEGGRAWHSRSQLGWGGRGGRQADGTALSRMEAAGYMAHLGQQRPETRIGGSWLHGGNNCFMATFSALSWSDKKAKSCRKIHGRDGRGSRDSLPDANTT